LNQLDFPLAAPSANPFGYISPTTAEHVKKQLGNKIPLILDGGACKKELSQQSLDLKTMNLYCTESEQFQKKLLKVISDLLK